MTSAHERYPARHLVVVLLAGLIGCHSAPLSVVNSISNMWGDVAFNAAEVRVIASATRIPSRALADVQSSDAMDNRSGFQSQHASILCYKLFAMK
jgi:hypothetical protein